MRRQAFRISPDLRRCVKPPNMPNKDQTIHPLRPVRAFGGERTSIHRPGLPASDREVLLTVRDPEKWYDSVIDTIWSWRCAEQNWSVSRLRGR